VRGAGTFGHGAEGMAHGAEGIGHGAESIRLKAKMHVKGYELWGLSMEHRAACMEHRTEQL
jgi:hypothetical protein